MGAGEPLCTLGTSHAFSSPPSPHQFEDDILSICLKLLDTNPKFLRDQNRDCSRRNDPVYIGRVVSAMVSPAALRRPLGCQHTPPPPSVTQLWLSLTAVTPPVTPDSFPELFHIPFTTFPATALISRTYKTLLRGGR